MIVKSPKDITMRYFFPFTFYGCLLACYLLSQPINAQSLMVPEKGWSVIAGVSLMYPIKESMGMKLHMGYDWGLNDRAKATLVSEKVSSRTTTLGVGLCLKLE